ncbi:MAG: hypothetical protein AAFY59_06490 [Pseudomonadota bacterium]
MRYALLLLMFMIGALPAHAEAQSLSGVVAGLETEGYADIEIEISRVEKRIRVRGERGDAVRELIFDATTGRLLEDNVIRMEIYRQGIPDPATTKDGAAK